VNEGVHCAALQKFLPACVYNYLSCYW